MHITQRAIGIGIGASLLQVLMLLAFVWPAANIAPRDLPLAVAGPQAAQIADRLATQNSGAFDIRIVPDAAAAREALEDREVYGALLTGGGPPRALVASGASPAVAQQLTQLANHAAGTAGVDVVDVVPLDPDDPRGIGFGVMVLPLVMSSIAAGVLLALLVPSPAGRTLGLAIFALSAGVLSMTLLQGGLSLLPGSFLALSAAAGLISFTVAASVAGLATVLGRPGLGLAALTMLLLGNPLSAASAAPELLPQPWGALGQLLPPGAGVSLLRSVAFFDGTASAAPLVVLLVWSVVALMFLGFGVLRHRSRGGAV